MAIDYETKLAKLLRIWPKGTALTSNYLLGEGYTPQLLSTYVKGRWIEALEQSRGVYWRPWTYGNDVHKEEETSNFPEIYGFLRALHLEQNTIHPSGLTALELDGAAHFIPAQNKHRIDLMLNGREHLPAWFQRLKTKNNVHVFQKTLFKNEAPSWQMNFKNWGSFITPYSCRERAAFELLSLVPQHYSLDYAALLLSSLTQLRSDVLEELLKNCKNFKTKRLLLALGEEHQTPWFEKLDNQFGDLFKKFSLGKGSIILQKEAGYSSRFRISIPAHNLNEQEVGA